MSAIQPARPNVCTLWHDAHGRLGLNFAFPPCSWQTDRYYDYVYGVGHNASTNIYGVNGSCWQQLAFVKNTSRLNFWVDQAKGATLTQANPSAVRTVGPDTFAIGRGWGACSVIPQETHISLRVGRG